MVRCLMQTHKSEKCMKISKKQVNVSSRNFLGDKFNTEMPLPCSGTVLCSVFF